MLRSVCVCGHAEDGRPRAATSSASSWICLFGPPSKPKEQEWLAPRCCPRHVHRWESREKMELQERRSCDPLTSLFHHVQQALLVAGVVSVLQPLGMWASGFLKLTLSLSCQLKFEWPDQWVRVCRRHSSNHCFKVWLTAQSLLALEALSPPGGCLRNPEAEGRGYGVSGFVPLFPLNLSKVRVV